jgi:hypothetical protein
MSIELIEYDNEFQIQIGIAFAKHNYNSDQAHHYHIWIDFGWYGIEITFKEEEES